MSISTELKEKIREIAPDIQKNTRNPLQNVRANLTSICVLIDEGGSSTKDVYERLGGKEALGITNGTFATYVSRFRKETWVKRKASKITADDVQRMIADLSEIKSIDVKKYIDENGKIINRNLILEDYEKAKRWDGPVYPKLLTLRFFKVLLGEIGD